MTTTRAVDLRDRRVSAGWECCSMPAGAEPLIIQLARRSQRDLISRPPAQRPDRPTCDDRPGGRGEPASSPRTPRHPDQSLDRTFRSSWPSPIPAGPCFLQYSVRFGSARREISLLCSGISGMTVMGRSKRKSAVGSHNLQRDVRLEDALQATCAPGSAPEEAGVCGPDRPGNPGRPGAGLWACGVKPAYPRRDPFAGFTPQVSHFQVRRMPRVKSSSHWSRTSASRSTTSAFPGTSRQARSGSSAWGARPPTAGRSSTTPRFAGWLRAFLPKADPSRKWEVINAGAISYASYRIKGLMAELAHFEPDLFIVYTGENEFLERRTYAAVFETPSLIRNAAGLASRTPDRHGHRSAGSSWSGCSSPLTRSRRRESATKSSGSRSMSVGPEAYTRDEAFQRQVLAHYEAASTRWSTSPPQAKARLLFVTPLSNLRDFAPFKSENRIGPHARSAPRYGRSLREGSRPARNTANWKRPSQTFDAALAIDDRHADLLYRKGPCSAGTRQGRRSQGASWTEPATRTSARCGPFRHPRDHAPRGQQARSAAGGLRAAARPARDAPDPGRRASLRPCAPPDPGVEDAGARYPPTGSFGEDCHTWHRVGDQRPSMRSRRQVEAGIDGPRYAQELYKLSQLLDLLGQPEQATETGRGRPADERRRCRWALPGGSISPETRPNPDRHRAFPPGSGPAARCSCAEEGLGALLLDQRNPHAARPSAGGRASRA